VPDPKTADSAFPTGSDVDVVDLLLTQHARIEEQFLLVVAAQPGPAKQEAFDDLVRLLSIHETAEEELIHPLSRGLVPGGDPLVDDRLAEERQANEILARLVKDGVDAQGFDAALILLREAVLKHARHEERYEFTQLRAKVPPAQLRALAPAVRAAEALAPTRPHPGTESATANLVAGPVLAIVDRARDLIRDARKNRG
jgi:Hemerythrin HHE cation binding domain